jgi:hypothetical protein
VLSVFGRPGEPMLVRADSTDRPDAGGDPVRHTDPHEA